MFLVGVMFCCILGQSDNSLDCFVNHSSVWESFSDWRIAIHSFTTVQVQSLTLMPFVMKR